METLQQTTTDWLEQADWAVECESVHHHTNNAGTVTHGGPARYYVYGPCKHTTGFGCEPAVLSAMGEDGLWCNQCRQGFTRDQFTYYRLDG